jgi:hypothetical protein
LSIEQYSKWEPVEGVATPVARALIDEDEDGLTVILMFSEIIEGVHSDLRIKFGRVPAYTIHEEFVHPWGGSEPPKLVGIWESYSYPLLLVQGSEWANSLGDRLVGYPTPVHYRFLTLDQIVDVLCNKLPEVTWVKGAQF